MFEFIKRWKERRRRKAILKDIKEAKSIYLSGRERCMCLSFFAVDTDKYIDYDKIQRRMPEFKPDTFNVNPHAVGGFWWNVNDRDSRIKAFDKLIEIYSKYSYDNGIKNCSPHSKERA